MHPSACCVLQQHSGPDDGSASCSVEEADGCSFMIRSINYMRTKVKEASAPSVYR
jgi:hypothetical protein